LSIKDVCRWAGDETLAVDRIELALLAKKFYVKTGDMHWIDQLHDTIARRDKKISKLIDRIEVMDAVISESKAEIGEKWIDGKSKDATIALLKRKITDLEENED